MNLCRGRQFHLYPVLQLNLIEISDFKDAFKLQEY